MPTVNNRGPLFWGSAFGSGPGGQLEGSASLWRCRAFFCFVAAPSSARLGETHRSENRRTPRVPPEWLEKRLVDEVIDQDWIVDLDCAC